MRIFFLLAREATRNVHQAQPNAQPGRAVLTFASPFPALTLISTSLSPGEIVVLRRRMSNLFLHSSLVRCDTHLRRPTRPSSMSSTNQLVNLEHELWTEANASHNIIQSFCGSSSVLAIVATQARTP